MPRLKVLPLVLLAAVFLAGPLRAAVTPSGDVEPAPTTWTSSTTGYVGNTANGTLTVNGGSGVSSDYTYLGYNIGVTGVATVDGSGTTWNDGSSLRVGYNGSGTLNITGSTP